jgi:hypothetical protein
MNNQNGTYIAHSPTKKVVLINSEGKEDWHPANEAVINVLSNSKVIGKGDEVEISFGDGNRDPEDCIVFLKATSKSFDKKGSYGGYQKKSFQKSPEDQDKIMRQNAMNRVVDLICADKVDMGGKLDHKVMEDISESFLRYFKTGKFQVDE